MALYSAFFPCMIDLLKMKSVSIPGKKKKNSDDKIKVA